MSLRRFFRLNREDRKVLVILIVLLGVFTIYVWAHNSRQETLPEARTMVDSVTTTVAEDMPAVVHIEHSRQGRDTLPIRTPRYPGPPKRQEYIPKLRPGATIDLNSADTLLLQRVPGIGASFARRIYKYRMQLGGYYCVEQLQEVFGMDRERYDKIAPFMKIRTSPGQLTVTPDSIPPHPYLSYRHKQVLLDILTQDPPLTWHKIMASRVFSRDDSLRLSPYLRLDE